MFTGNEVQTAHDSTGVTYRGTRVVQRVDSGIQLNSNGWQTVTTKRRMNQWSDEYGAGFEVYQKDFNWFVTLPSGETIPYSDGMVIR